MTEVLVNTINKTKGEKSVLANHYFYNDSIYFNLKGDSHVYKLHSSAWDYPIRHCLFNYLCQLFWEWDKVWVNSFGRVTGGIGYEYEIFGLPPSRQVNFWTPKIQEAIHLRKDKWVLDISATNKLKEYYKIED